MGFGILPFFCLFLLLLCFSQLPAQGRPTGITRSSFEETIYYLVVNGKPSGEMVTLLQDKEGRILVNTLELSPYNIDITALNEYIFLVDEQDYLDLSALPDSKVDIDKAKFEIKVTLPTSSFKSQNIDILKNQIGDLIVEGSDYGSFINYNLTVNNEYTGRQNAAALPEVNFFTPAGSFFSNFLMSVNQNDKKRGLFVRRMETYWAKDNIKDMTTIQFGDIATTSSTMLGSLRLGGIKFGSNFKTQPDFVSYYQPTIQGSAAIPSTIDVYANSMKIHQEEVQSGEYILSNLPMISGSGDLVVESTDLTGKKETITIPYFVAPSLLKPGLTEYFIELGGIRKNMMLRNIDYGRIVGSGTVRYGVTEHYTPTLQLQLMRELASCGLENAFGTDLLGTFTISTATSRQKSQKPSEKNGGKKLKGGHKLGFGYSRKIGFINAGYNISLARNNFADATTWPLSVPPKLSQRYFASTSLGDFGTISVSYTNSLDSTGKRVKVISSSYSASKSSSSNPKFGVTFSRNISSNSAKQTSVMFTLAYTIGEGRSLSASLSRSSSDRKGSRNLSYSKNAGPDGGYDLSASLAYASKVHAYGIKIGSKGPRGSISIDGSGNFYSKEDGVPAGAMKRDQHKQSLNVTGALVYMDGDTFMTDSIHSSLVLAQVGHLKGVKVYGENRLIGETNEDGKALVPNVIPFHPYKVSINEEDFPVGTIIEEKEHKILLPSSSGKIIDFDVKTFNNVTLKLIDKEGHPIREGQNLKIMGMDNKEFIIGYNGIATVNSLPGEMEELKGLIEGQWGTSHFEAALPSDRKEGDEIEVKVIDEPKEELNLYSGTSNL